MIAFANATRDRLLSTAVSTPRHTAQALTRLAKGGNAEIFAWGDAHVVKLFRPGLSKNAVEFELKQACIAHAAGIPTPRPEEIIEIEGRHGIVLERCDGPTLLEILLQRKYPVDRTAQVFFELQRAIHGCDGSALPPLEPRLAIRVRHAVGLSDAVKQAALDQINRLPRGAALCHGDFHPVNVIMSARGPVVIDWMDAGRGEAAMDLARSRLLLEFARPDQVDAELRAGFLAAYAACCREAGFANPQPTRQWLLPVAVARLAEQVGDAERQNLTALIGRITASGAQITIA